MIANDSSSSKLPQWDNAYLDVQGYSSLNELMRAMILRTVEDFHAGGEFYKEAVAYMYNEDEDYVLSFYTICRHLNLDPAKTRHAIMFAKHKISTRRRSVA